MSGDHILLTVRVVPRSSRSEIVGEYDGALKVKLASPPVDGAANEELVGLLARSFGVARSDIAITAGHTSRIKKIRINGLSGDQISAILQPKS